MAAVSHQRERDSQSHRGDFIIRFIKQKTLCVLLISIRILLVLSLEVYHLQNNVINNTTDIKTKTIKRNTATRAVASGIFDLLTDYSFRFRSSIRAERGTQNETGATRAGRWHSAPWRHARHSAATTRSVRKRGSITPRVRARRRHRSTVAAPRARLSRTQRMIMP